MPDFANSPHPHEWPLNVPFCDPSQLSTDQLMEVARAMGLQLGQMQPQQMQQQPQQQQHPQQQQQEPMQVMHGMRQLEAPPTLDDAAAIGNDVFTSEVDNSIDNFAPSPKRAKVD